MSLIARMLRSKCTYWPPGSEGSGGVDFDDYGQPVYADPVELSCRWEEKIEEFLDSKGTLQVSKAVVYVSTDVSPGGVLMHEELANVGDTADPKNNDGAWEIRRFDKLPNFKDTEYLRTAYL